MSLLFKRLRIHQVFGANTDVGKTILTCALVRASALTLNDVFYLKPLSTGPHDDADDRHIQKFTQDQSHKIRTDCLFRFDDPVSPHLAARLSSTSVVPSDKTFVNSIADYIRRSAKSAANNHAHMYIETAGGVHSPSLSGSTQIDAYRPLFLPTILIGDSKLGGISTTISAYESLLLRGFIVDAVLLFQDDYYRNDEYLASYFADRCVHLAAFPKPPPIIADNNIANAVVTAKYYDSLDSPEAKDANTSIRDVIRQLDICHEKRIREIESMPRRTLDSIWWPFVQHNDFQTEKDVTVIDSAHSDFFTVHKPQSSPSSGSFLAPEFDGSASWWTQAFGHANVALTLAAARASGRYGHVMFPRFTHQPALRLAEKLLQDGPGKGWAKRAFFSDNGSTGMEVALKMALRAFTVRSNEVEGQNDEKFGVLGIKGSYHGDTIGAMDACEEAGVYTCEWHDAKGYWFDPPTVGISDGQVTIRLPSAMAAGRSAISIMKSLSAVYDVNKRLDTEQAKHYERYITKTLKSLEEKRGSHMPRMAALVLEPLVMGAGGMIFVDPLFQRILIDVVRKGNVTGIAGRSEREWSGLPVIFDEVFVGLYRLGVESAGPTLGTLPDIAVNAKVLTGGLIPLAVTLASESIFAAFLGDSKAQALLHGHSYTAHAVGCEVAGETLRMLDRLKDSKEWKEAQGRWQTAGEEAVWSLWDPEFVKRISECDTVEDAIALGTVLRIEIKDETGGYESNAGEQVVDRLRDGVASGLKLSAAPGGEEYSVHLRTLGNVVYVMASLNTAREVVESVEERVYEAVTIT